MKRFIFLALLMSLSTHAFASTPKDDEAAMDADAKLDRLMVQSDISQMKMDIAQLKRDVDELKRKARI